MTITQLDRLHDWEIYSNTLTGAPIIRCKNCNLLQIAAGPYCLWTVPDVSTKHSYPVASATRTASNGDLVYRCEKCSFETSEPRVMLYGCPNEGFKADPIPDLTSVLPEKDQPPPLAKRAKTEQLGSALYLIPFEGLEAVGQMFQEGLVKYGPNNLARAVGDTAFQQERCNHAIRHLMLWANGDRTENHLAKVTWFGLAQIWLEAQEEKDHE